jgi:hypothetical protein
MKIRKCKISGMRLKVIFVGFDLKVNDMFILLAYLKLQVCCKFLAKVN